MTGGGGGERHGVCVCLVARGLLRSIQSCKYSGRHSTAFTILMIRK